MLRKASDAKNAIFHDFPQKGLLFPSVGNIFDPQMILWLKELFDFTSMPANRNFVQERSWV